ncbi:unnamed protein product [Camellia sinensis]
MVKWLKVGGFIFFRESCFHQSGDCKRKNNLTHYREPRYNTKVYERYVSGSGASPNVAVAQFLRAKMLPSGDFIRPCKDGGSIIHKVDMLIWISCQAS